MPVKLSTFYVIICCMNWPSIFVRRIYEKLFRKFVNIKKGTIVHNKGESWTKYLTGISFDLFIGSWQRMRIVYRVGSEVVVALVKVVLQIHRSSMTMDCIWLSERAWAYAGNYKWCDDIRRAHIAFFKIIISTGNWQWIVICWWLQWMWKCF